jgi:hypothetical protein
MKSSTERALRKIAEQFIADSGYSNLPEEAGDIVVLAMKDAAEKTIDALELKNPLESHKMPLEGV